MADIPLGDLVKRYFEGRKEYVQGLPQYSALRGPGSLYSWHDLAKWDGDKVPNANPFVDVPDETYSGAEKVVSQLFNAPIDVVRVTELAEMHSGKTLPVRITAEVKGVTKVCYAKVPDAARFIALELYNIISGAKPLDFVFNEGVCVDEQAPGKLFGDWNVDDLLAIPAYIENRVRLDSRCTVIGLNDLRINPGNTAIDNEGNIFLFDFDEGLKYRVESLITGLSISDNLILQIQNDERNLIARRAMKELVRVQTLIDIMRENRYNANEARQYQLEGADDMGDVVAYALRQLGVPVK